MMRADKTPTVVQVLGIRGIFLVLVLLGLVLRILHHGTLLQEVVELVNHS